MALELRRYRFTIEDYHRIAEAGILGEDDRVELIEGDILEMSPIGHRHAGGVNRLTHLFVSWLGDRATVAAQNPIQLSAHNEPRPDLALLRPRDDFYAVGHPTPADVLLVIEVADSSVEFDRQVKAPLYARGGIPEYWLADVGQGHLTVYREPTGDGYETARVLRRGETIRPLAFPDLEIAVADVLGEPQYQHVRV